MTRISLNANHYLKTSGRRTPDNKYVEYQLNDTFCNYLEKHLKTYENVEVERADGRNGNVLLSLAERVSNAIKFKSDLLITVDHNALDGSWGNHNGTEVFTYNNVRKSVQSPFLSKSKEIAKLVLDGLLVSGLRNRGLKTINWQVLRTAPFPSIGIEVGFMDSRIDYPIITDLKKVDEMTQKIAENLATFYGWKKIEQTLNDPPHGKILRVVVGSYKKRSNALDMQNKLKEKGFNSFLVLADYDE